MDYIRDPRYRGALVPDELHGYVSTGMGGSAVLDFARRLAKQAPIKPVNTVAVTRPGDTSSAPDTGASVTAGSMRDAHCDSWWTEARFLHCPGKMCAEGDVGSGGRFCPTPIQRQAIERAAAQLGIDPDKPGLPADLIPAQVAIPDPGLFNQIVNGYRAGPSPLRNLLAASAAVYGACGTLNLDPAWCCASATVGQRWLYSKYSGFKPRPATMDEVTLMLAQYVRITGAREGDPVCPVAITIPGVTANGAPVLYLTNGNWLAYPRAVNCYPMRNYGSTAGCPQPALRAPWNYPQDTGGYSATGHKNRSITSNYNFGDPKNNLPLPGYVTSLANDGRSNGSLKIPVERWWDFLLSMSKIPSGDVTMSIAYYTETLAEMRRIGPAGVLVGSYTPWLDFIDVYGQARNMTAVSQAAKQAAQAAVKTGVMAVASAFGPIGKAVGSVFATMWDALGKAFAPAPKGPSIPLMVYDGPTDSQQDLVNLVTTIQDTISSLTPAASAQLQANAANAAAAWAAAKAAADARAAQGRTTKDPSVIAQGLTSAPVLAGAVGLAAYIAYKLATRSST